MNWLLDTNVISEIQKPRPSPRVVKFFQGCAPNTLFLSIVSTVELAFGATMVRDPVRRLDHERWLELDIRPKFAGRLLPISEAVLLSWMRLVQDGRRQNHTFAQPDLFLAATALEHNLTLVTRNVRDFAGIENRKLLNPWDE